MYFFTKCTYVRIYVTTIFVRFTSGKKLKLQVCTTMWTFNLVTGQGRILEES